MVVKKYEIIDKIWFTPMGSVKTIGIVIIETLVGERKAYIGIGDSGSELHDTSNIANSGAKLHAETVEIILQHLNVSKR